MQERLSRKRPWLAALLATVATGLGHLYLRRWKRAFGWLAVLFAVTALFVDPSTISALRAGSTVSPSAIAPVLIVGGLSTVDAYLLAHAQNAISRITVTSNGRFTHCPNCRRELDAELDFCHWCATNDIDPEAALSDKPVSRERN
ncbi:DUF7575 domain-containing protein [Halopelagius fulvigenes]|uniref:Zinc ribbon domain-containing protein n=1 Tax=Halopelagius fulvigenes TaxID=1198324 RepID=A0ABD5U4X9_9EURY